MNKAVIVSVILTATVLLTGCTTSQAVTVGDAAKSTKSAAPVEQGSRRVLTTAEATAALPTVADLGTGWLDGKPASDSDSTDDSSTPTFSPADCSFSGSNGSLADLAIIPTSTKPVAQAQGDFHMAPATDDTFGLDVHAVSVAVKSYKNDVDSGRLADIAARLKKCATFTASDPSSGITSNWQINPVSLPNYGDGTLAFRMQGSVAFLIVLIDSVQIIAGHNLITISQSGLGKIDTELAGNVAKAVMSHLAATK